MWKYVVTSFIIKLKIFHLCRTRVICVALVSHLCHTHFASVSVVSHSCHSCRIRVTRVALVSHSCRSCRAFVNYTMFPSYRIAIAPFQFSYRIGFLFALEQIFFGMILITERGWNPPILKVIRGVSDSYCSALKT